MLKLFKQSKYLIFCSLCDIIDVVDKGVTFLAYPVYSVTLQGSDADSRWLGDRKPVKSSAAAVTKSSLLNGRA